MVFSSPKGIRMSTQSMNKQKRQAQAATTVNFAGHVRRSPKKKRWWKVLLLVACGLLVVVSALGALSYRPAQKALAAAKRGQDAFLAAQSSLEDQNFSLVHSQLETALAEFSTARTELEKLSWLRVVPFAERQYRAAYHLLLAGVRTGDSISQVADFGRSTIEPFTAGGSLSLDSLSPSDKRQILKNFTESQTVLAQANEDIDAALEELNRIPETGLLRQLQNAVDPVREKLPLVKKVVDEVATFSRTIPLLAGYPEERTYLFLLENNTELRPAGGFIGTYGVLRVQDGEIEEFTTDNIYNIDIPAEEFLTIEPPAPLKTYLKSTAWFLRDSNWSPDFPTSAEEALRFYQLERGPVQHFDGVIAVTPTFIESLIGLTGSLQVENVTFTKENFIDTLQYQVEQGYYRQGISESERKEIIGELADMLLDRLLALPQSQWDELWSTFTEDVAKKQIMIYLRDPSLQSIIEEENWGGATTETVGDYLAVVDANMASLKSDPGVKRTIDYSVTLEGGKAFGDLTVTYRNEGTITWKSTRYRTFVRVYTPEGSTLLLAEGYLTNDKIQNGKPTQPTTESELGKTVFAGFTSIEPQETGTIHLRYELPESVAKLLREKQYLLDVQKQAGAGDHVLNLRVNGGYRVKSALPFELNPSTSGSEANFSGFLNQDYRISVTD